MEQQSGLAFKEKSDLLVRDSGLSSEEPLQERAVPVVLRQITTDVSGGYQGGPFQGHAYRLGLKKDLSRRLDHPVGKGQIEQGGARMSLPRYSLDGIGPFGHLHQLIEIGSQNPPKTIKKDRPVAVARVKEPTLNPLTLRSIDFLYFEGVNAASFLFLLYVLKCESLTLIR